MAACLLLPREGSRGRNGPLLSVDNVGPSGLASAAQIALAVKAIDTAYRLIKKYNQNKKRKVKKSTSRIRKRDATNTSYRKGS